jgi:hypothetical protein
MKEKSFQKKIIAGNFTTVMGYNHGNFSAVSKLVTTIKCLSPYNLHLILAV